MFCKNCGKEGHLEGRCPSRRKEILVPGGCALCRGKDVEIAELKSKLSRKVGTGFNKLEYQREYMRKRRNGNG